MADPDLERIIEDLRKKREALERLIAEGAETTVEHFGRSDDEASSASAGDDEQRE